MQSARTKSEVYHECLPLFHANRVRLPDHPRLKQQLLNLERRALRGGRDSIDHRSHGHDDVANSVCRAILTIQEVAAVAVTAAPALTYDTLKAEGALAFAFHHDMPIPGSEIVEPDHDDAEPFDPRWYRTNPDGSRTCLW